MRNYFPNGIAMIVNTDNETTEWNIRSDGYGRAATTTTNSGSGEQSGRSTKLQVNEGGLLDLNRKYQTKHYARKVLQLMSGQRSIQSQRIEHELVHPESCPTSISQFDSEGTGESRDGHDIC
ncbi:MAG: hypothetical protein EZS28_053366, partial [Streblomastix strix]